MKGGGQVADRPLWRTALAALFALTATALAVAIFVVQNGSRISRPGQFLAIGIISGVLTATLAVACARFVGAERSGALWGVAGYLFFSATWIPASWSVGLAVTAWLAVAVLATEVVVWIVGGSLRTFALSSLALATLTGGLMLSAVVDVGERGASTSTGELAFSDQLVRRPNVYLMIVDAFTGPETLDRLGAGQRYQPMIDQFEMAGGQFWPDAVSNYPQTILSIPNMLTGDYAVTPENPAGGRDIFASATSVLSGANPTVDWFRRAGYRYWHASNGSWSHSYCEPEIADRCLGRVDDSTIALWANTPLARIDLSNIMLAPARYFPDDFADELADLDPTADERPLFVFAHFMTPHAPFNRHPDCTAAPTTDVFFHMEPFQDQAECVLTQLVSAATSIREHDPGALILIQADHGHRGNPDIITEWNDSQMVDDSFSTLRVTFMPPECRTDQPEASSAVNLIPLVKACLTGGEPEWEEARYIVTTTLTNDVYELADRPGR